MTDYLLDKYAPPEAEHERLTALSGSISQLEDRVAALSLDLSLAASVIGQVSERMGAHLEALHLQEQTRLAQAETEALLTVSLRLNAAKGLGDIVDTLVEVSGASSGALFVFDGWDALGQPELISCKCAAPAEVAAQLTLQSWPVRSLPFSRFWLAAPSEPLVFENLGELLRTDPARHRLLHLLEAKAAVFLALRVADEWVGLLALAWRSARTFSERDAARLKAAAAQAAQVMQGRLMVEQEHRRVSQLAMLARLERALAKARSEEDLIEAVIEHLGLVDAFTVSLVHLHANSAGRPESYAMNTLWSGGGFRTVAAQPVPLGANALTHFWQQDPETIVCVSDAFEDLRVPDELREQAAQDGWRAAVVMPLRSVGEWQGLLMVTWREARSLSLEERFLFPRVAESLGSAVASRKAQLAGQAAQQDSERRARRETALRQIAVALANATGVEVVVRTAQQELEAALGPQVAERLVIDIEAARASEARGDHPGVSPVHLDLRGTLSADDRAFLEAVALQVTQTIERVRLAQHMHENLLAQQRLSLELETVAQVSVATSTILERHLLLQEVVDLTKARFNLYHAQFYVLDEASGVLQLVAGAGHVGRQTVTEGRTLHFTWGEPAGPRPFEAGSPRRTTSGLSHEWNLRATRPLNPAYGFVDPTHEPPVVRAARQRSAVVVPDVSREQGFQPHRLLPETRSLMCLPLVAGDRLLGVLDVQSDRVGYFKEKDVRVYTTLAAQIAVALQNANLYAEQAATVARLKELDHLKSAFLANMSHELRTPLNSILGFTDVILEGLDGPVTTTMATDLKVIQKNGRHLLELINDVLDMAKIEAGAMAIALEPLNLSDVLAEVVQLTHGLAREKDIQLSLDVGEYQTLTLMADPVRLRQVLINVVGNAIKFTERGEVAIKAELISPDAFGMGGDRVRIEVRDTGIGIPPEKLETIFEAFSQVDTTTTRKSGGTGLGLPISRNLIELHGGRMWAESAGLPGLGSRFCIELPAKRVGE